MQCFVFLVSHSQIPKIKIFNYYYFPTFFSASNGTKQKKTQIPSTTATTKSPKDLKETRWPEVLGLLPGWPNDKVDELFHGFKRTQRSALLALSELFPQYFLGIWYWNIRKLSWAFASLRYNGEEEAEHEKERRFLMRSGL